ncbi:hypothetical protein ACFRCG_25810 [Embleya sp. NPDC056575]|uniref:hypothetical protein n=1 Tax=unclassified Embleya TaxID=2699296 RepID=UPI0036C40B40
MNCPRILGSFLTAAAVTAGGLLVAASPAAATPDGCEVTKYTENLALAVVVGDCYGRPHDQRFRVVALCKRIDGSVYEDKSAWTFATSNNAANCQAGEALVDGDIELG